MYCPKCGTKNLEKAKYCKECGQQLESITHGTSQKLPRIRLDVLVALVLIGSLVLGIGIFTGLRKTKPTRNNTGVYWREDVAGEYLMLNEDGTCLAGTALGETYSCSWKIEGNAFKLIIGDEVIDSKIVNNEINLDGRIYKKGKEDEELMVVGTWVSLQGSSAHFTLKTDGTVTGRDANDIGYEGIWLLRRKRLTIHAPEEGFSVVLHLIGNKFYNPEDGNAWIREEDFGKEPSERIQEIAGYYAENIKELGIGRSFHLLEKGIFYEDLDWDPKGTWLIGGNTINFLYFDGSRKEGTLDNSVLVIEGVEYLKYSEYPNFPNLSKPQLFGVTIKDIYL